jgi:lysophospholipase L1-like esterase
MAAFAPPRASRSAVAALAVVLALVSTACDEPGLEGSPVCRRGGPGITVYQGPEGACIPRTRVVGYRCDDAEPIVVFDAGSGDERRFLGGDFAVQVPSVPEGAEVVGVGDGAQLVTVHDEPRRLYTVKGSSIWRWLALPKASALAEMPAAAFLLGDSLLDGGAPAVLVALPEWSLEIDAFNGRGSADGAAIAEARTTSDQAVVVELGTNDQSVEAFTLNAERILRAFRTVPLVLWQNVEGPPEVLPAEEINAAIETLAGHRPNVAIADWDAAVPEEDLFDGVHPDPAHLDAMANLIAPMLERWRAAATDRPSCR